ncbi:MAG: hypothetical protein LBJ84_02775 [Oscillospiraceae bacterium]|jgi:hypothetical protein|nr:hypothetical protein [Oscillospiraceae bacterium]
MADAGLIIIILFSVIVVLPIGICILIAIGYKFGRKIAIIVTAIAVVFVGSAVLYFATRHSADLGLQFVEAERNNYTKIQWGENIYIRAETRPLGRQSFTVGKFISLIDGNRGFKVFEIPGISAEEWIRVQFWGDSWSMYRREGATGDFPGSSYIGCQTTRKA